MLAPLEAHNIKTILRGIENSADPEEIYAATMPTWQLDTKALMELIGRREIREVISLLDTWGVPYGKPLREGYGEYEEEKRLLLLEMGLDRFVLEYYRDGLEGKSENGRIARSLLARKIDVANILNALKFVSERFLPDHLLRYYIRGGAIDEDTFLRLSELAGVGDLLEAVPAVLRGKEWEGKMEDVDLSTPLLLETFLNREVRRFVSRTAVERPLTIAVPIAFLYAKYSEVERLRLVAAGITFTIPRSDLRGIVESCQ